VGIDCALHLAIDEQPVEEFDRAFDRNSSGEKSAGLRGHDDLVGWPRDDRRVWPIRLRAFGSLVRGKKGKSVHDENCAKAGAFRKRNHACGRTIWIVDAHRDDGRRFIVHADEKLSAFVELEREALTVTFYLASIHADSCR
jgi:hypothetical protein